MVDSASNCCSPLCILRLSNSVSLHLTIPICPLEVTLNVDIRKGKGLIGINSNVLETNSWLWIGGCSRCVQRHHYLYLFNQQNDLSLYLYSDRGPNVGVVYKGSHVKSHVVFSNLIYTGNGIVLPLKHQLDNIIIHPTLFISLSLFYFFIFSQTNCLNPPPPNL